jgi:hypothetical protein
MNIFQLIRLGVIPKIFIFFLLNFILFYFFGNEPFWLDH